MIKEKISPMSCPQSNGRFHTSCHDTEPIWQSIKYNDNHLDTFTRTVISVSCRLVWKCPKCGRVYVSLLKVSVIVTQRWSANELTSQPLFSIMWLNLRSSAGSYFSVIKFKTIQRVVHIGFSNISLKNINTLICDTSTTRHTQLLTL